MEKIETVKKSDDGFPELLRNIPNAPETIFYRGAALLNEPAVAIVGTRKCTPEGREIAREFARELAGRGFEIISGLALGIDGAAHTGALEAGGKTRAVLAGGPDKVYPPSHEGLARKILSRGGSMISEYPPGTPAFPNQFLDRNRIISGLAIATIVIEAPAQSGALATARHAAEQGREVFILPGPVGRPNFKGSHALIRKGARLVTSIEDVLEDMASLAVQYPALGTMVGERASETEARIEDENQRIIFETIKEAPAALDVDKISELTKLPTYAVNQSLAFLILYGFVNESGGKYALL